MPARKEWEVRAVTVTDAAALARNNMSAFWEDAVWRLCFPNVEKEFLIAQSAKRQAWNLLSTRDKKRHLKAVDPATGALAGYCRWVLPEVEGSSTSWPEAQVPDVSPEEREALKELSASALWEPRDDGSDAKNVIVMDRILASKTYIKLEYLAVHPDYQGQGAASALVEAGVRHAKEVGIPIFVMAFEAGRGVYERLGFREVERVIQDATEFGGTGEYRNYFMVTD